MHALASSISYNILHAGVSPLEKMARTALVYAALILVLRFVGRRTLAQLNPFDLVVLLLLSNVVQNAIIGPDNSVMGGVIGAFTLVGLNEIVVRVARRHARLNDILAGRRSELISDGKINERGLKSTGLNEAELTEFIHADSLDDVERMTLLPGGKIDVHKKGPAEAATRADLARVSEQLAALQVSVAALSKN
ncbi:MAG: YetF domain-containing protein [Actinomycetes bacterium]